MYDSIYPKKKFFSSIPLFKFEPNQIQIKLTSKIPFYNNKYQYSATNICKTFN